ncbi:hypothetical protein [Croceivirga thetidis]|uniref:hypothetical protein n=1 Tax=Croceivirga thetidis TaxID=2721623 RepID=UPI001B2FFBEF|nr:hypothetical protein [Croceivirga thetidis]
MTKSKNFFFLFLSIIIASIHSQDLKNVRLQNHKPYTSPNGKYGLVMQDDGNLVIYNQGLGTSRWASNTMNKGGNYAQMQNDGNLVIYKNDGTPVWSTGTHGNTGATLKMQNDGNLVIYSSESVPLWSSNSQARPGNFPIRVAPNCNRIAGKSWRCCGQATLTEEGVLSADIKTSSNNLRGFTGGIKFTFYDIKYRPIYFVYSNSYGVNAESSRNDAFSINVEKGILPYVAQIEAVGVHNQSCKLCKQVLEAGLEYLKN